MMFITYVGIEDQRRDEGLRYAVYLAHRTEAGALRKAEVDERQQMLQHFSVRAAMITDTHRQSGRAIQAQAMRHVLHMEAQGRAWVSSTSHAIHHLLLTYSPNAVL